jgi:hypothetical protein
MELLSYWIPWPVGDSDDCGSRVSSREDKEYGSNRIPYSSMPALRVRIAGEQGRNGGEASGESRTHPKGKWGAIDGNGSFEP